MDVINPLFTLIALAICLAGVALYLYRRGASGRDRPVARRFGAFTKKSAAAGAALEAFLTRYHVWLVIGFMLAAVFVRFRQFPGIPPGLNQDEASIAYDSYAIGNFGMDRNGDYYPVYPIAFGDGHGPLYTYLSIPAIKLLGLSVFSFRLTNALLGCAATFVFYLLIKRVAGKNAGLFALALMAACPTSILSSRWALDGNPLPSVFILAVYFFVVAAEKQKTWLYMLSAAVFALTVYCYGPAGVVTPLFLLLACLYLIRHKKLKWPQFFCGIASFLVAFAPLGLFLAVNAFDWPAIRTPYISFPKFTVARSGSVFLPIDGDYLKNLAANVVETVRLVVFQRQDLIWNMVPGFGTTYLFTAPLIVLGAGAAAADVRKRKEYNPRVFLCIWFLAAVALCLLIRQNVNRIGVIYPAVLFLIVMAVRFLYRQWKPLAIAVCLLTAVTFGLFTYHYFNVYPEKFGPAFFSSFGDALECAMEKTDGTIYVTETNQNEPSVITLFYAQIPPQRFVDTVKYYDDHAEWRNAMYFDRFRFGIPEEKDPGAVYVIDPSEAGQFDPEVFRFDTFAYYLVAYAGS